MISVGVEGISGKRLTLSVLAEGLAICRLNPGAEVPAWAQRAAFSSVTRTTDELSIICPEGDVPPAVSREPGWRALKLEGPFDLAEIGILAAIATPLAEAGVSVLAVGTYDTDYVLVKEAQLERAIAALLAEGHSVRR